MTEAEARQLHSQLVQFVQGRLFVHLWESMKTQTWGVSLFHASGFDPYELELSSPADICKVQPWLEQEYKELFASCHRCYQPSCERCLRCHNAQHCHAAQPCELLCERMEEKQESVP